jgi:hypothetical protein
VPIVDCFSTSNYSPVGTDLVLAEKDVVGKFALTPAGITGYLAATFHHLSRNLFAAIWQSDHNKSPNFCIDISIGLH